MTKPDEALPAWCVRLISELNAADERATALAKTLTPGQLNWTPAPGVWSIGQCLEHLYLTNREYLEPISNSLMGAEYAGFRTSNRAGSAAGSFATTSNPRPKRDEPVHPGRSGRAHKSIPPFSIGSSPATTRHVSSFIAPGTTTSTASDSGIPSFLWSVLQSERGSRSCRSTNAGTCCKLNASESHWNSRRPLHLLVR